VDHWIDMNQVAVLAVGLGGLLHLVIRLAQAIVIERVERRRRLAG
jgi:hypothetical protein